MELGRTQAQSWDRALGRFHCLVSLSLPCSRCLTFFLLFIVLLGQIRTSLQMIQVNDPQQQTAVHVTRQRSAFPPNFIRSLDSTHMLMTALACRRLAVRTWPRCTAMRTSLLHC